MTEANENENIQYLTFELAGEAFAFNVLKTREVLNLVKITKIPRTPDFMSGVINLRGSVVPVIDLRKKFSLPDIENTVNTSIIIVEVIQDRENLIIGALVDSVKAVSLFDKNQTEPPPKVGMKLNADLIDGLAKKGNDFVILLNIDKLFSDKELNEINELVKSA
jgi:purine-binding chemotaxis protein CheW